VALVVGGGMFFAMNRVMNPPKEELELNGTTISVTIPEGAGTEEIANILKENDLISSVFGFKLTSKLEGFDGTYKCGTYNVDTGMTKRQIMELLQSGKVASDLKLMVPEGNTVKQIAARAEEAGICTAEEFIAEANTGTFDYEFLKDLPEREYRLEGYLFPDTYFLSENMTAHDVIDTMLKRFDQMYTEEYRNAVASSGHTLDEIVTLASMVEKEIKLPEERTRAAGVMYNRLRDGITLGIDATVLYAVGKTAGELTQADLNTDSPYNTRINYGLPLGPIANPGEASFKAALYPETHNYLYYVVEAVGKDNHVYCETYDEFLSAKAAYNASAQ
ncbi:MAG: endolytic transglycosylase MltG, partial [Anaerotignum sp.]|nr:endolytic transglycosylase MltG [Anaerotignum sp.]